MGMDHMGIVCDEPRLHPSLGGVSISAASNQKQSGTWTIEAISLMISILGKEESMWDETLVRPSR